MIIVLQMTLRLAWALHHVPGLKDAAEGGRAIFGGVDCWLLYKLTGENYLLNLILLFIAR